MITPDMLGSIVSAQKGDIGATQLLYELVCTPDVELYDSDVIYGRLQASYAHLIELTRLSQSSMDETIVCYLNQLKGGCSSDKYFELVNVLRFYGFTLLVKFVENNWHLVSNDLKLNCKSDLLSLFSNGKCDVCVSGEYNSVTCQKAAQYISTIAIREWPNDWIDLIPICITSIKTRFNTLGQDAKVDNQTLNEIYIFLGLLSEVAVEISECMDNKMLYKRKTHVTNVLKSNIFDIFVTIHCVIMIGIVEINDHVASLIQSIFLNLSCILDGFLFIEFDVDEFLTSQKHRLSDLDTIQTMFHIARGVAFKHLKDQAIPVGFSSTNEKVYAAKLNRFICNLVAMDNNMSTDAMCPESVLCLVQLSQAIKTLVEKNASYLIQWASYEAMHLLYTFIVGKLLVHPSMEVATLAANMIAILLKRLVTTSGGKRIISEYKWLQHQSLALGLFIRCLKIGNCPSGSNALYTCQSALHIDQFVANAIGKSQWCFTVQSFVEIDSEIAIGQLRVFESRFATLRSSILNCVSALASLSAEYMDMTIKCIADLFSTLRKNICMSSACDVNSKCSMASEKFTSWMCIRCILFDGVCFLLEGSMFKLRAVAVDAAAKHPEWMIPSSQPSQVFKWQDNAVSLLIHLLTVFLSQVHGAQLEIRRIELLASCSPLFFFKQESLKQVLEYIVSILLLSGEKNSKATKLHKAAICSLDTICRSCPKLVRAYVQPILEKMRMCLNNVESDSMRDILLESIVSLSCCTGDISAIASLSNEIVSPYLDEIQSLATLCSGGSNSNIQTINTEIASLKLFNLIFGPLYCADATVNNQFDVTRRKLRRMLVVTTSIITRSALATKATDSISAKHPLYKHLSQALQPLCIIVAAIAGMWQPSFFGRDEWRKSILCPGEEEWISLQGYNEAIATEDSLRQLVEAVFTIPASFNADVVRKCRRHAFLLRQAALRLCGEILVHYGMDSSHIDIVKVALVEPLKWTVMSHAAQFLKFAIIPAHNALTGLLPRLIDILLERVNSEYKALNRLGQVLLHDQDSNTEANVRTLHLYYLRLYACIETGMQLFALLGNILKGNKSAGACLDGDLQMQENDMDIGAEESSNTITPTPSGLDKEISRALLSYCCNATCWPHVKSICEGLRIIRAFCKCVGNAANCSMTKSFLLDTCVYLHSQVDTVGSKFDPLTLGNDTNTGKSAYQRFWSPNSLGETTSNYIKEFANTISTIHEILYKNRTDLLFQGQVQVSILIEDPILLEATRQVRKYMTQEYNCLTYIQKILQGQLVEARTILFEAMRYYAMVSLFF